jgi:16S rRNA (guanine527-N7)-methyltransferase
MKNVKLLVDGLNNLKINIDDHQIKQFELFYDLVVEWNKKINLTSIVNEEEFIVKHILDSVLIQSIHDFSNVQSIIDIGTGAGFPGIPLKIIYPNKRFVLLDSLNKRIKFLNIVSEELNLTDIEYIHGRAEDFGQSVKYREIFDLCVSRAVSNLSVLAEYCIPFVKVGGHFIPYKSSNSNDEIHSSNNAINTLGGDIKSIEDINIPFSDIKRTFVVIDKCKKTHKIYPRRAGIPSKKAL